MGRSKKISRDRRLEEIYPHAEGRRAGDEAVDKADMNLPFHQVMEIWRKAYREKAGHEPFAGPT